MRVCGRAGVRVSVNLWTWARAQPPTDPHVRAPTHVATRTRFFCFQTQGQTQGQGQRQVEQCRKHQRQEGWSAAGAQGDEHADGWTWSGEQADGWWNTTDWQTGSQTGSGSRWWMTANDQTLWYTEETTGGFEINSTERSWSNSPIRGIVQVGRWQRSRKQRQTVISPTPTEQRVAVPPEVLHDTRICIEDHSAREGGRD